MGRIEKIIEKSVDTINSVEENALYSVYDFPIGGITASQMVQGINVEGLYQVSSVYLCVEGNELYHTNHCYRYEISQWIDITPWREIVDTNLNSITTIEDNKVYNIEDYPIGGITNEQMNKALTDNQKGLYKVNSVYLCVDEDNYLKNHFYKFNDSHWEDVTPEFVGEIKEKTLEEMEGEVVDENTIYSITDYPIGGITNAQMTNALKSEQFGFYKTGSVYMCIDEGEYVKNHFYKFSYDEENDIYSWIDTKAGADIDIELSLESENPIANKTVAEALNNKVSLTGDENIYGVKNFEFIPKLGIETGYVLPSDYQEVAYIKSSGSEYIDTGIIGGSDIEFEIDFQTDSVIGGDGHGCIFGSRSGTASNEFQLITYVYSSATSEGAFGYKGTRYNAGLDNNRCFYAFHNNELTRDGVVIATVPATDFSSGCSIYIFADNSKNSLHAPSKTTLYGFKIWSSGELVRDFVPCYRRIDGKVGLYDKISEAFFVTSAGELLKGENIYHGVDFATIEDTSRLQTKIDEKVSLDKDENIKGQKIFAQVPQVGVARLPAEFTEIEYIEANKQQWIDTGIKFETGFSAEVKFNMLDTANDTDVLSSGGSDNWLLISWLKGSPRIYLNGTTISPSMSANTIYTVKMDYITPNFTFTINDLLNYSKSKSNCVGSSNLHLFARNSGYGHSQSRVYYCKMYKDGLLVRDFVPCYVNTEVVNNEITYPINTTGLYDLVEGKFYKNGGTEEFIMGEEVLSGECLVLQSEVSNAISNATKSLISDVIEKPVATEESPIFIQINGNLYFKQSVINEDIVTYKYMKIQLIDEE